MFSKMTSVALVALFLLSLAGDATATKSLSLELSGARNVKGVDNFSVMTTVTNTGDETIKLYKDPRSALSPFPEETFNITSATGSAPKFVGAHAKYRFKTATNFVTLSPGENTTVIHHLGSGYNFTEEGEYKIDSSDAFFYEDEAGNPQPIHATVISPHEAKLDGDLVSSKRRGQGLEKRATFTGCSSSRKTAINTALKTTTTYLANAVTYLNRQTRGTKRYTTWFGAYSSSRKATVLSHYKKIQSSDPRKYKYDCSCTDDLYAYVYPDEFGIVYLCTVFWSASTSGTDSKAGTIIHESSHFTRNGGTKDYAYGQTRAQALAVSTPTEAIRNADSHEYFAENNPSLS